MLFILSHFFRFFRRLLLAAAQLFILAVLSWQLLRLYPGDRWLPVRLGSYFTPWLLLGLFPALGVALLDRQRWFTLLGVIALLGLGARYSYMVIPRPRPAIAGVQAETLKVMTFNVLFGNRNAEGIAEMIQAEKPDILAFQEMTQELGTLLQPKLAADYPYIVTGDNIAGFVLVIASRYPLVEVVRRSEVPRALQATAQTPHGPIVLWNLHPVVAVSSERWQIQRDTFEVVAQEVAGEERPVIVMGDFNTTDQAENYSLLAGHLIDVNHTSSWGFNFTFPDPGRLPPRLPWYAQPLRLGPVVRIDHILVSSHFTAREIRVLSKDLGSDHRPVVANLYFTGEPAR